MFAKEACIRRLMVIDCKRKWDQDARNTGGGQLGDSYGAGTTNHHVCPCVKLRHILQEWVHLSTHCHPLVGGMHRFQVLPSGLMQNIGTFIL